MGIYVIVVVGIFGLILVLLCEDYQVNGLSALAGITLCVVTAMLEWSNLLEHFAGFCPAFFAILFIGILGGSYAACISIIRDWLGRPLLR